MPTGVGLIPLITRQGFNIYFLFSFSTKNRTIKVIQNKTQCLLFVLHLCEQDAELL